MIDFSKKIKKNSVEKLIDPERIYDNLDREASAAGPLRPVQSEVLSEWFNHRFNDHDLIVKLHTGEGKTLVGLLMLQSKLNEGEGPCIYVCPNKQLALQVAADARKFGVRIISLTSETELPLDFTESKVILVTHVQKVFNGKTIFGLRNNAVEIGTFLLDDSHACIDAIKESYTVSVERNSETYQYFISLFEHDLQQQGEGSFREIIQSETDYTPMQVPYWSWIERHREIADFMAVHKDDKGIKFAYPLLKDIWRYCSAFFTGTRMEIIPDFSLLHMFTSFTNAKHRILMSATTQDDSFFVKGLGFSKDAVLKPLTSNNRTWSGEKMILFPTLIGEGITSDYIREIVCHYDKPVINSRVVLVPSFYCADFYKKNGAVLAAGEEVLSQLQYLDSRTYDHTVVFVNRYDGIDLADYKCRLLIIDSLPKSTSLADRYEESCREKCDIIKSKIAQRIEQGLGRSVRSEIDYSVILIIDEELVRFIRTSFNLQFFSPQTRKQIEISEEILDMIRESDPSETKPFDLLFSTMKQCLKRDQGWKDFYKERMNSIVIQQEVHPYIDIIEIEREAELAYSKKDFQLAEAKFERLVNKYKDSPLEMGWYLQKKAKCAYFNSKLKADDIQKMAYGNNDYILMPNSYTYQKIGQINETSILLSKRYLQQFNSFLDLKLAVDDLMSKLVFGGNADSFESSLQQIGKMLGYVSQRPDKEIKRGPDNLWMSPKDRCFFVFESKNEVLLSRETINKEEVGQFNNHIGWFEKEYGNEAKVVYIHIHPTSVVSDKANYNKDVKIMNPQKLEKLKQNIIGYIKEFATYDLSSITESFIQMAMERHNLIYKDFVNCYTVNSTVYQPR